MVKKYLVGKSMEGSTFTYQKTHLKSTHFTEPYHSKTNSQDGNSESCGNSIQNHLAASYTTFIEVVAVLEFERIKLNFDYQFH